MIMVNTRKLNYTGMWSQRGFCYLLYCPICFPEGRSYVPLDADRILIAPIYWAFAMWEVAYVRFPFNTMATLIHKEWSRVFQSVFYTWGHRSPRKLNNYQHLPANEWNSSTSLSDPQTSFQALHLLSVGQRQEQPTHHNLSARQPLFKFLPPVRSVQP